MEIENHSLDNKHLAPQLHEQLDGLVRNFVTDEKCDGVAVFKFSPQL